MFSAEEAKGMGMFFTGALENECATTRKVIAAFPDAQLDFKPGEKAKSAHELIWHLVQSEIWFGSAILKGEFGAESEAAAPATVAEMVAAYDAEVPKIIAQTKEISGDQLAKVVSFYNVFNFPLVMYMNFWLVHSVHHRGQLSTYLRCVGARVPSIYGGSADEPFEMPASA